MKKIKEQLAEIFAERESPSKLSKIINYSIVGLILLSTIEVFLSTYDNISENYEKILHFVDIFTTVVFTIEVTLRIWVADLVDEKYKGFVGRLKYCFSFYGLIDILSTYPFYINFIFPIPYTVFKILRVARLLRIFRYMSSFKLLTEAVKSKKEEMLVSLQFLVIVTLILSFILFFVEHKVQPEAYSNGMDSAIWAFAQYIGDPGGFADNPPITFAGRIIACIIGILGIALFAVPAGLIGSGFMEALENKQKNERTKKNVDKLHLAFERKLCRYTKFQIVPRFVSMAEIQAKLRMNFDDVVDAVENSDDMRLVNMGSTRTIDEKADDLLAVENFYVNTPYGCCIDRHSKVTIVAVSPFADPVIGHFAYYLAKIGGFNYISREKGNLRPYRSFYLINPDVETPNLDLFLADVNRLANKESHWVITLIASSGANEPSYPTQLHFNYGGDAGDESYNGKDLTIHDINIFDGMYNDFSSEIEDKYNVLCDKQRYNSSSNPKLYLRHLEHKDKINSFVIRAAWSVTCWDPRSIQIAQTMAEVFNRHFESEVEKKLSPELKVKDIGYSDYKD